ncbi:MAG: Na+/H+ antiporter subunit E [Lachnospiraceae bacterium]|nr:Na+/H+ antiporter subunit E [Lachnospiraceae bacterium]
MFVLFYILWLIFNGRITVEILIMGLLVTALVSFIFYRLIGYSFSSDIIIFRNLPLLILYLFNLVREVVIAAFSVMAVVWNPDKKPDPVLVEFHSGLNDSFSNVLLANSITLTPGTYTVLQEEDRFVIHCLRREYAENLDDSSFIHLLRKMRV